MATQSIPTDIAAPVNPAQLNLLLVEDSPTDAELIERSFSKAGYKIKSRRVQAANELTEALAEGRWDAIVSDFNLPQFTAFDVLEIYRQRELDMPILVVSGVLGEENAVGIMQAGAHDYISKGRLGQLPGALERAIREVDVRRARRFAEEGLRRSLAAKEALLREVHHRVKNNLQMVCSLMRLHLSSIEDSRLVGVFQQTERRILCLSAIHDQLCLSENPGEIDLGEHVRMIAGQVFHSIANIGISLALDVRPVAVTMDIAIPCGLILNELVSNALLHAFPEGRHGTISVSLEPTEERILMRVQDDGIGFTMAEASAAGSLGLRLVHTLARQLEGTASVQTGSGTCWEIRFSIQE